VGLEEEYYADLLSWVTEREITEEQ